MKFASFFNSTDLSNWSLTSSSLLTLSFYYLLSIEHTIYWSLLDTSFRDTGLQKLVFKVLLDGTEVALTGKLVDK